MSHVTGESKRVCRRRSALRCPVLLLCPLDLQAPSEAPPGPSDLGVGVCGRDGIGSDTDLHSAKRGLPPNGNESSC